MKTRMLAPLTLVATLAACQSAPNSNDAPRFDHRPDWVSQLREEVEPVPQHAAHHMTQAATPTEWSGRGDELMRGRPADLTRRLDAAPPRRPTASPSAPAAAARAESAEDGPIVVNINTSSSEPAPGVGTPPAPSGGGTSGSTLERLYRGRFDRTPDRQLEQFGYRYFEDTGPADRQGPVPSDYVVGPDDEVLITVWGSVDANHRLLVDREGQIAVPDVGAVTVAGHTFGQLGEIIRAAYAQTRKDFELYVSLGRLRRIRVHLVGEVTRPGAVEVPAQATVLTAMIAAGGPKKNGSLRRIELRRAGSTRVLDLYSFLTSGESTGFEALHAEDVVFVPPIGPTIGVAGFVQRPGIYELLEAASIDEAIGLAGGLTPFTFTPHVQLERTVQGRGREILDIPLDDSGRQEPMGDGELLLIGAVDDQMQPVVLVSGAVVRPGSYQFRPGLNVRDLIEQADGLTIDAYLPQAFVSRQIGETGCVDLLSPNVSIGSTRRVLVVDLNLALSGDPAHDLELMPLDHVEIRAREEATVRPTVEIIGAVQEAGTYELTAGLRVSDLVAMAGNLQPEAYHDEAELIRRMYDAASRQLKVRRFRFDLGLALRGGDEHDPVLQNEDRLVVRTLRSGHVTISIDGEVKFPGTYVFPIGARLTDLLAAAGGVVESGDLRAAVFTRESVRRLQQERLEHLRETTRRAYEGALESMVQSGRPNEGLAAKLSLDQTRSLMDRMSRTQASGRIVIPFLRDDFPETRFNLSLENGDRLLVPRLQETVAVIGHVFNPTTFVAEPGLSVEAVLARAGGLTEFGDQERTYVMRADGNVESLAQSGSRLRLRTELEPGDVVLVPREPLERTFGAQMADVLMMARQAAEVALLFNHVGRDPGDLTNILQPQVGYGLRSYEGAILND
jgi:protein involved in polysaccharide export with SLBB domain